MVIKLDDNKYEIKHLNESLTTIFYEEISDELYDNLVNEYTKKPNKKDVYAQLKAVAQGSTNLNFINAYYVKDLMDNTKLYYNKWSISEMLDSKELMGHCIAKMKAHPNFYTLSLDSITDLCDDFKMCLRLGNKGVASNVYNFPLYILNQILAKYNVNNNYYDFSCGWGARLLSALSHSINYFGTDPNYILCERLNELESDFRKINYCNSKVNIYCQGSEILIDELKNKIGLAFSSPPYFCLEDYKIGNQSYKEDTTYEDWLTKYLKPTFENIYQYLIDDGYFLININDFDKYTLSQDTIKIAEKVGFKLLGTHRLKNIERCNSNGGFNDNSEKIFVFCKQNSDNKIKQLSNEVVVASTVKSKKLF